MQEYIEVKADEAIREGRYDDEPVWHLECYEKVINYVKDKCGLL